MAGSGHRVDLDTVKELSYLLFSLAEKRSWASTALLFNSLGTSWSDIEAAARTSAPSARRPGHFEFRHWGGVASLGRRIVYASKHRAETGCTRVLEAVPELRTEDLRNIDMDQRLLQFRNKSKGKYADKTLEAYRKRFEQSVSMYCSWLVDEKDWMTVRPRRQSSNRQTVSAAALAPTGAQQLSDSAGTAEQRSSPMVTYPLPIRSGLKATLILPRTSPSERPPG